MLSALIIFLSVCLIISLVLLIIFIIKYNNSKEYYRILYKMYTSLLKNTSDLEKRVNEYENNKK